MHRQPPPNIVLFLAAALMVLLAACGGGTGPDPDAPQLQLGLPAETLVVSETLQAAVSLHGFPLLTSDVTDLYWSSDEPEIATVDGGGLLTGLSAGTATIRVSSRNSARPTRDGHATIKVVTGPDQSPVPAETPLITAFSAESVFRAGTTLTLSWSVQHATSVTVELEQEADGQWTEVFQSVKDSGEATVPLPLNSSLLNFRLTAVNDTGEETSQLLAEAAQPVSGWICTEPEQQIQMTDPVIEAQVRRLYGLDAGPLLCADVQRPIESRLNHEDSSPQETANMLDLNTLLETTSLEGLQHLTHLSRLELMHNELTDIHPLHGLTSLTELNLDVNDISDLSPLAGLTELQVLGLYQNDLIDLRPLAGLTELRILFLSENGIHDLSPLQNLTKLEHLWLFQNCRDTSAAENRKPADCLRDLEPIATLGSLRTLLIKGNEITSIRAVAGLAKLELLEAADNLIADLAPLSRLGNLRTVTLDDNPFKSLMPLVDNTDFAAGDPYTFTRGIAKLPIGNVPYPHLGLGYNCIQDDPDWVARLATLRERGAEISGDDFLQNIRDECTVPTENAGMFEGQNMRLLLRQLQLQEFLQKENRNP